MKQKISLGFSPCPNDTFMFCALVNEMIDCEGLKFEPVMEDVETLNQKALKGELDISKLSLGVYAQVAKKYVILNSGSALGKNCGPLLISKIGYIMFPVVHFFDETPSGRLAAMKIAIPGKYTTANLLFSIFFPDVKNKKQMIFSEIEDAVLHQKVDMGVIIHESRFTYRQKRLYKVADLGTMWQKETKSPLPLGCIAAQRKLDKPLQKKIDALIHKSIQYAIDNPDNVMDYVRDHSQEMEDKVMLQHIDLYVNDFSLTLGAQGKKAIELLLRKGNAAGLLPEISNDIFIS